MNRTRIAAAVCGAIISAALAGCGGNSTGSASISGTVTGLDAGASVSIANNGGTPIVVSSNTNFTFGGTVASNSGYSVAVTTQPAGQTCVVNAGSGLVDFAGNNVNNVVVKCIDNTPLGVKVTGLNAGNSVTFSLALQNDPQNITSEPPLTISSNTTSNFPVSLPLGTIYSVSVSQQPSGTPAQSCLVSPSTPFSGGVVSSAPIVVEFDCK